VFFLLEKKKKHQTVKLDDKILFVKIVYIFVRKLCDRPRAFAAEAVGQNKNKTYICIFM